MSPLVSLRYAPPIIPYSNSKIFPCLAGITLLNYRCISRIILLLPPQCNFFFFFCTHHEFNIYILYCVSYHWLTDSFNYATKAIIQLYHSALTHHAQALLNSEFMSILIIIIIIKTQPTRSPPPRLLSWDMYSTLDNYMPCSNHSRKSKIPSFSEHWTITKSRHTYQQFCPMLSQSRFVRDNATEYVYIYKTKIKLYSHCSPSSFYNTPFSDICFLFLFLFFYYSLLLYSSTHPLYSHPYTCNAANYLHCPIFSSVHLTAYVSTWPPIVPTC